MGGVYVKKRMQVVALNASKKKKKKLVQGSRVLRWLCNEIRFCHFFIFGLHAVICEQSKRVETSRCLVALHNDFFHKMVAAVLADNNPGLCMEILDSGRRKNKYQCEGTAALAGLASWCRAYRFPISWDGSGAVV